MKLEARAFATLIHNWGLLSLYAMLKALPPPLPPRTTSRMILFRTVSTLSTGSMSRSARMPYSLIMASRFVRLVTCWEMVLSLSSIPLETMGFTKLVGTF